MVFVFEIGHNFGVEEGVQMLSHHLDSAIEFITIPKDVVTTLVCLFVVGADHDVSLALGHLATELGHFTDHSNAESDVSLELLTNQVGLVDGGEDLSELSFELSVLGLSSLDSSFFLADALFSLSLFFLLIEALLLEFEFHLSLHAGLSLLSFGLGICIRLLGLSLSLKLLNLSLELGFHLSAFSIFSGLLTLHLLGKLVQLLLSFRLQSCGFGSFLSSALPIIGHLLFLHGESERDLRVIRHGLTTAIPIFVKENGSSSKDNSVIRLKVVRGHGSHLFSVDEDLLAGFLDKRNKLGGVSRSLENGVVKLDTNTSKFDGGSLTALLATDFGVSYL